METETLVVFCHVPDRQTANSLAHVLLDESLAACVNILPEITSVYRWQGQIETANEIPLIIKTTRARYAALEARVSALHPYSVPEIIALPVSAGLPAYLTWVAAETLSSPEAQA